MKLNLYQTFQGIYFKEGAWGWGGILYGVIIRLDYPEINQTSKKNVDHEATIIHDGGGGWLKFHQ